MRFLGWIFEILAWILGLLSFILVLLEAAIGGLSDIFSNAAESIWDYRREKKLKLP